jgi:hypothetical protein
MVAAANGLTVNKIVVGMKNQICLESDIINHNWQGGKSFEPYCFKFNNQLKERIRERDNRTCQLCGDKENGRKLSVHHIHYLKSDCEPDLVALCLRCNVKVNKNKEFYEGLFMNKLNDRGLLFGYGNWM